MSPKGDAGTKGCKIKQTVENKWYLSMLFGVYAGMDFFFQTKLLNLCLFSWMLLAQVSPGHIRSFGFNQWAPRILDRDLPSVTLFWVRHLTDFDL